MRRVLTTWFLLLALGLPLAQPVAGSWHCPDGTLCIAGGDGRYECAGKACPMACCAALAQHAAGRDCCRRLCRHGDLPYASVAPVSHEGRQHLADCVCRFTATARLAAAVLERTRSDSPGADFLMGVLPAVQALDRKLQGIGSLPSPNTSSPPALRRSPTGTRAPPIV